MDTSYNQYPDYEAIADAQELEALREEVERLRAERGAFLATLQTIASIGGNLSDEAIQRVGGVNDARALALKVVQVRKIAREAIDAAAERKA